MGRRKKSDKDASDKILSLIREKQKAEKIPGVGVVDLDSAGTSGVGKPAPVNATTAKVASNKYVFKVIDPGATQETPTKAEPVSQPPARVEKPPKVAPKPPGGRGPFRAPKLPGARKGKLAAPTLTPGTPTATPAPAPDKPPGKPPGPAGGAAPFKPPKLPGSTPKPKFAPPTLTPGTPTATPAPAPDKPPVKAESPAKPEKPVVASDLAKELLQPKRKFDEAALKPTSQEAGHEKDDSELWFVVSKMFQYLTLQRGFDAEVLFEFLEKYDNPEKKPKHLQAIQKEINRYIKNKAKEYYNPADLKRVPEVMKSMCSWSGSYREFVDFIDEIKILDEVVKERTAK
ncbi:MAG: hypothetical protein ACTSU5_16850 [Promethearchaeota archaeon]